MKELGHLMLDLETMGNKSNAAIVSIGAVEFDINTGETGREFYRTIDLQSSLDAGLAVNGSTIEWWFKQKREAQERLFVNTSSIYEVIHDFASFLNEFPTDLQIWGNGARFDIGLLEDSCVACGFDEMPWSFRNERDVRTLVSFRPEIRKRIDDMFVGIQHDPIADCKHQIHYCSEIWRTINNLK